MLAVSKYDEHGVVLSNMSNIKTIVDYYTTKLEHWAVNNPDKTMSQDEVIYHLHSDTFYYTWIGSSIPSDNFFLFLFFSGYGSHPSELWNP